MRKIIKKKNNISSVNKKLVGIGVSSTAGTVITVILTILFSYTFANSETLSNSIGVIFIGCLLVGALICGVISSRMTDFKGIIAGVVSSHIYCLLITVIMLFFSDGKLSANTFFLYLGICFTSAIGGILGANIKRRK